MEEERSKDKLIPHESAQLSDEIKIILEKQNSRMVSDFQANKLETHAAKNWDMFYKRNETRFFKNRQVTNLVLSKLLN